MVSVEGMTHAEEKAEEEGSHGERMAECGWKISRNR
jgi:hypothetical protein